MELKLTVTNAYPRNTLCGSLPWLLNNAAGIRVGLTSKTRNLGAWLLDKEGKIITILALQNQDELDTNGNPAGPIRIPDCRDGIENEYDDTFRIGLCVTDACWEVIQQIQKLAVAEMRRVLDDSSEDGVSVVLVRTQDETARKLAGAAVSEPTLLPILQDRLKEVI